MQLIYHADKQFRKVRFVQFLIMVAAAATAWGGVEALLRYGLHHTEGGVLAPLSLRIFIGGAFFAFSLACTVGIWAYSRCYVRSIAVSKDARRVVFTVAGIVHSWPLEIGTDRILRSDHRSGISDSGAIRVNAPWFRVQLAGRRLPLIVDAQGEFLDWPTFAALCAVGLDY